MSIEVGGPVEGSFYETVELPREERLRRFQENLNALGGGCPVLIGGVVKIVPAEQAPVARQVQSVEQEG